MTEEADSNLYVNPLEAAEKCGNRVKKSTSGEIGRNVDASPSIESSKDLRPFNEGSKITLNDTVPKHKKIRIQEVYFSFSSLIFSSIAYARVFIKYLLNAIYSPNNIKLF